MVDLLLAQRQQLLGVREAKHLQRAHDLLAVVGERRQIGAFVVVPEERVEHLLHMPQVRLDFARDLGEQQTLLRTARHFVEQRRGGAARGPARIEPRDHRVDLGRQLRRGRRIVLDRRFGEQQSRRVFHGECFGNRSAGQLVQPVGQRSGQPRQRRLADRGGLVAHGGKRLLELGQALDAAAGQLEPQVLRGGQKVSRLAQMWLHAHDVGGQHVGGRNQAGQPVRALYCLNLRTNRSADRDIVKHLAAHPVGDLGRPFHEAPNLQIDAAAQLLDAEAALDTFFDDALEQCAHRPPEGALRRVRLHVLDALHRVAHHARAFFVAAQPCEQSALVQPTLFDEVRRKLFRRHRLAAGDLRSPR